MKRLRAHSGMTLARRLPCAAVPFVLESAGYVPGPLDSVMKNLVYPGVALGVALVGALVLWLAMRGGAVAPNSPDDLPPDEGSPYTATMTGEREYNPAAVSPNPVQSEHPQPFRPPKKLFRIEVVGRVVSDTMGPVAAAHVRFVGEGSLSGVFGAGHTDAAGRYRLVAFSTQPAPPLGLLRKGRVVAQDAQGAAGSTPETELPAADEVTLPDVILAAGAEIRGRVIDPDGLPVSGVAVQARSSETFDMIPRGLRAPRVQHQFVTVAVTTDMHGDFRFTGLRPGTYALDAGRSWHGMGGDTLHVETVPGGTATAELSVSPRDFLRGVLRDADGLPIACAVVRADSIELEPWEGGLQPADAEAFRGSDTRTPDRGSNLRGRFSKGLTFLTDAQGRFGFFALQPGTWRLSAALGREKASIENLRPGPPDHVLTLDVRAAISGRVRNVETGAPIEFFDVRQATAGEDPSPLDRVAEDRPFTLQPLGEFRLQGVAGMAALQVAAPGFAPARVELDGRRTGIEIALRPLCDLTLQLNLGESRLDVEPVVLLFNGAAVAQTTTDEAGRARLWRVAPGRYEVNVFQRDGTRLSGELEVPARARAEQSLDLQVAAER